MDSDPKSNLKSGADHAQSFHPLPGLAEAGQRCLYFSTETKLAHVYTFTRVIMV